jgi:LysR family transcriptional regulator, glycine cleavage system transcriptional activator
MSHVPSLTSLRLLVAAARQSSLTLAAGSIGITQSAASRRIAAMEAELGVELLKRNRRGVELTDAGQRYVAAIAPALEAIAQASDAARTYQIDGPLRLRVYSTFAARWLLARLPDFQDRHRDIELQIDTAVAPVSFDRDGVDLAIQFGHGHWPDTAAQLLMHDEIEPVCTPEFARAHGLSADLTSLASMRLLESRYRRTDWEDWAGAADVALDGAMFMRFQSSLLTFQAAIDGVGLAMGQTRFLAAELAEGTLVAPFSAPLRRPLGYYLVAPKRPESPHARAFRRWITGQTEAA